MLRQRKDAPDIQAFDSGYDEGWRIGYYERRSPRSMRPEHIPARFDNEQGHRSYVDGWQEGYFKGSRARELNR